MTFPDEEVELLWGFVDQKILPQVISACERNSFHYYSVSEKRKHSWHRAFDSAGFLLDTTYGEYSGFLGTEIRRSMTNAEDETERLTKSYRKKNPRWSNGKYRESRSTKSCRYLAWTKMVAARTRKDAVIYQEYDAIHRGCNQPWTSHSASRRRRNDNAYARWYC